MTVLCTLPCHVCRPLACQQTLLLLSGGLLLPVRLQVLPRHLYHNLPLLGGRPVLQGRSLSLPSWLLQVCPLALVYLLCRLQAQPEQCHFLLTTNFCSPPSPTHFFFPLFRSGKEGGGFSLLSFTCAPSSCTPFAISTDQLVVLQVLI